LPTSELCYGPWQINDCWFSVLYLWRDMSFFGHAVVTMLLIMLANTVVIACHRLYRYSLARSQSRAFVGDANAALHEGRFSDVIRLAGRKRSSPIATLVAAGLTAFASAPQEFTVEEAAGSARRAFHRTRSVLRAELMRGLGTLSTIASSAPFIGLLGTVFGILNAFRGTAMQKAAAMAMVASYLAESLVTTAMGMVVAIAAVWCRNYLIERVENFENEMSNAALETISHLKLHPEWRSQPHFATPEVRDLLSGGALAPLECFKEVSYDPQRSLLAPMYAAFCFALFVLSVAIGRSLSGM
jgi:biopolymer transport protein ExbB/TolQ